MNGKVNILSIKRREFQNKQGGKYKCICQRIRKVEN